MAFFWLCCLVEERAGKSQLEKESESRNSTLVCSFPFSSSALGSHRKTLLQHGATTNVATRRVGAKGCINIENKCNSNWLLLAECVPLMESNNFNLRVSRLFSLQLAKELTYPVASIIFPQLFPFVDVHLIAGKEAKAAQ